MLNDSTALASLNMQLVEADQDNVSFISPGYSTVHADWGDHGWQAVCDALERNAYGETQHASPPRTLVHGANSQNIVVLY